MKKSVIILSALIFSVLALNLVVAQALPAPPIAMKDVANFFTTITTGTDVLAEDVVARVLLFLLLTIVLYRPAEKLVGGSRNLGITLSIIVSLIAVRFLTLPIIKGLFLPYQALGIVISVAVPFMLFGGFLTTSDIWGPVRRLLWALMMGVFTWLWFFRWSDIGDLAWIYACAAVLCFIMIWADSSLRSLWYKMAEEKTEKGDVAVNTALVQEELAKVIEAQLSPYTSKDLLPTLKDKEKELRMKLILANKKLAT